MTPPGQIFALMFLSGWCASGVAPEPWNTGIGLALSLAILVWIVITGRRVKPSPARARAEAAEREVLRTLARVLRHMATGAPPPEPTTLTQLADTLDLLAGNHEAKN